MKLLKTILAVAMLAAISASLAACETSGGGVTAATTAIPTATANPTTTANPAATAAPTTVAPTTTSAVDIDYTGAIIVASGTSTDEWKNKATYVCKNGELPPALRSAIQAGNKTFLFAPGEYYIDSNARHIYMGSKTTIVGATQIIQPENLQTVLYPDAATMAVFKTRADLPSTTECTANDFGQIVVRGNGCKVVDIALAGYSILKIENASNAIIARVLVHNYNGTYPNGSWCNMGYGRATGSIWIFQNNQNIKIENCQIQFSSHHGFLIHSGTTSNTAKDITLTGVRALYSGCGQLMGQNATQKANAAALMPETKGHGYYDWSVGFDLCESQTIINVKAINCYAYEGWKAGFYTEPAVTGGIITNLQLFGCRSENAGQRAMLPGTELKVGNNPAEDSGTTIFKEGEGANFYLQGGYFEDCVSVNALKTGWYVGTELRTTANGYDSEGRAHLVDCGDMGSPISLLTEMFDCPGVHTDRFFSLNAKEFAMWLFSGDDNKIRDTIILCSNKVNEPIKIGYMLRMQLRFSRDANNQRNTSTGGKYDVLRGSFTNGEITGTVYGLPTGIDTHEIVSGASFSGPIALTRNNTDTINPSDYVN